MNQSFLDLINKSKIKFDSICFPLRNKTYNFMGTDTQKLWNQNKKNIPSLDYYNFNKITYRLNNFGYRTPYDFKKGDEVNIFLGCSHTIGYGIELEKTWPYLLNEKIGGNLVNLAVGGCPIDRQFRELYTWMNFFNVKNIFHFQPLYAREEFLSNHESLKFTVHSPIDKIKDNINENFLLDIFGSDIHIMSKYTSTILAIEGISNRIGSDYYYLHELPKHNLNGIPARDNMHMDVSGHQKIYEDFYEKFKNRDRSIKLIDTDFKFNQEDNLI